MDVGSPRWRLHSSAMRLFHFSDDPDIAVFEPRPVKVPSVRQPGREWLNGPLVWAIDEQRQPMYLFPRECPRILLWPTADTSETDLARWWGARASRAIAHIEWAWFDAFCTTRPVRYELPAEAFESLDDAGMWVARSPVRPIGREMIEHLPTALRDNDVELRVMQDLSPLKGVWSTTLHASGIRLRNASNWQETLSA